MESRLEQLLNKFESLVQRFETAQDGAQGTASTASSAPTGGVAPQSKLLRNFDTEVLSKIKPLQDAAEKLGGDIIPKIVSHVKRLPAIDHYFHQGSLDSEGLAYHYSEKLQAS